jgi:hypothetical protein
MREMLAAVSPSIDAMIAESGVEHLELSIPDEPGITLSVDVDELQHALGSIDPGR